MFHIGFGLMGDVKNIQSKSQRKSSGSTLADRVHDAEAAEILMAILCNLKKIELHLSMMTNTTISDK